MHRGVGLAPLSAARCYARPGITYVPTADAEPSVAALAWRDQPGGLSPAARAFVGSPRPWPPGASQFPTRGCAALSESRSRTLTSATR